MNAMPDSNSYRERTHDEADVVWARIEAGYRDEAVADVEAEYVLVSSDWGEPTAHLTADEDQQFMQALELGDSERIGTLYLAALDRMRAQYMTSDGAEQAIQARIMELAEENA